MPCIKLNKFKCVISFIFPTRACQSRRVRRDLVTKQQTDGLKCQKYVLLQFWRLEVQNQGLVKAILPWKPQEEDPFWLLPVSGGARYVSSSVCISPIYISSSLLSASNPALPLSYNILHLGSILIIQDNLPNSKFSTE